jgi:uncharacterized protein (TIGR00251 family)
VIALVSHARGTVLSVRAQPGARQDAILGVHDEALRVAVSAPPDKGKANAAIETLLADALGCRRAQVGLLSGATSRRKRFLIEGLNPAEIRDRLAPLLSPDASEAD